jgi:hypothetical protein
MRSLRGLALCVVASLLMALPAAAESSSRVDKAGKRFYRTYDARNQCKVIYRGETPPLEMLEAGIAYILDIPLAMLSPLTCPIVRPILDRIDSDSDRTYRKPRSRR